VRRGEIGENVALCTRNLVRESQGLKRGGKSMSLTARKKGERRAHLREDEGRDQGGKKKREGDTNNAGYSGKNVQSSFKYGLIIEKRGKPGLYPGAVKERPPQILAGSNRDLGRKVQILIESKCQRGARGTQCRCAATGKQWDEKL